MEGEKLQILKTYFGYDSFRPGQEEIIDQIWREEMRLPLCYRSRKIIMLSGSGIDDAGNYDRDLPFDLFDDGSGEGVE